MSLLHCLCGFVDLCLVSALFIAPFLHPKDFSQKKFFPLVKVGLTGIGPARRRNCYEVMAEIDKGTDMLPMVKDITVWTGMTLTMGINSKSHFIYMTMVLSTPSTTNQSVLMHPSNKQALALGWVHSI